MSLKKLIAPLLACQLAMLPSLAQAQSSNFDQAFSRPGAEARLSFTIPLGHSSDKTKTAPRLNLGVRNYSQSSKISLDWVRADRDNYQEVRLGFTLEEMPKLMMNEQVLVLNDGEQANIGTAGKIGIGVAAVAVVFVAVVAVAFASCSDDPGGCFGDE